MSNAYAGVAMLLTFEQRKCGGFVSPGRVLQFGLFMLRSSLSRLL